MTMNFRCRCFLFFISAFVISVNGFSQVRWLNVDSLFGDLPGSVHVFKTLDSLDGKPNIAYYVVADLKDKDLDFDTDTTLNRRLKPSEYFEKNKKPLIVVNTTFFSFATNQNLNVVIQDGRMVGYNIHTLPGRGKDTFTYRHPLSSAIAISRKRKADVAWVYSDSSRKHALAVQKTIPVIRDSLSIFSINTIKGKGNKFEKWKMQTAVGGGPVLVQNGVINITNNEEWRFPNKAIDDKHPRTAMGYTQDSKLIIMVVEGRNPGKAEGVSLRQLAALLKDIGCYEALNLDGGGSSCMLVNGKETIKVSDAGQRPVPAVFIIRSK